MMKATAMIVVECESCCRKSSPSGRPQNGPTVCSNVYYKEEGGDKAREGSLEK
jgi:hypothetical protein